MISLGVWIAGLFGKSVSDRSARFIGIAALVVLVVIAFCIWLAVHDRNVRKGVQDQRDAEVATGVVKADRSADEAAAKRAETSQAEDARLGNAMAEAKRTDPDKGQRAVGNVSQSYFDNLPERRR